MKMLAALLLAAATVVQGAGATVRPTQIQSEYRVSLAGLAVGRLSETYERTGERYAIQSVARTDGLGKLFDQHIVRESRGRIGPAGLQPLAFARSRTGHPDRDVQATFDWERGVMRSTFGGEVSEVPLPRDTQDELSLMYQFMNLRAGEAPTVVLPMSNGRKVDLYTYRLLGTERIATPLGEFETLHYERVLEDARESRAEVWIAPARFNLPVRVRYENKGLKWENVIVGLEAR